MQLGEDGRPAEGAEAVGDPFSGERRRRDESRAVGGEAGELVRGDGGRVQHEDGDGVVGVGGGEGVVQEGVEEDARAEVVGGVFVLVFGVEGEFRGVVLGRVERGELRVRVVLVEGEGRGVGGFDGFRAGEEGGEGVTRVGVVL